MFKNAWIVFFFSFLVSSYSSVSFALIYPLDICDVDNGKYCKPPVTVSNNRFDCSYDKRGEFDLDGSFYKKEVSKETCLDFLYSKSSYPKICKDGAYWQKSSTGFSLYAGVRYGSGSCGDVKWTNHRMIEINLPDSLSCEPLKEEGYSNSVSTSEGMKCAIDICLDGFLGDTDVSLTDVCDRPTPEMPSTCKVGSLPSSFAPYWPDCSFANTAIDENQCFNTGAIGDLYDSEIFCETDYNSTCPNGVCPENCGWVNTGETGDFFVCKEESEPDRVCDLIMIDGEMRCGSTLEAECIFDSKGDATCPNTCKWGVTVKDGADVDVFHCPPPLDDTNNDEGITSVDPDDVKVEAGTNNPTQNATDYDGDETIDTGERMVSGIESINDRIKETNQILSTEFNQTQALQTESNTLQREGVQIMKEISSKLDTDNLPEIEPLQDDHKTFKSSLVSFVNKIQSSALVVSFNGFKDLIKVPSNTHCPSFSIDLSKTLIARTISTTLHCDAFEANAHIFRIIFEILFLMAGFRIVAGA